MYDKKAIVMIASYGGPYRGNFIPALIAYSDIVHELGYRSVFIFPKFADGFEWKNDIVSVADKVYYIPYKPYSLDNIKRIRDICFEENAVLLYSRLSGWDITARLAMPSLPLIWHMEMGLDLSNRRQKIKYWIKYRALGFGKTYHIAVSEATTESINSLGVKNQCEWIPNAIDVTRLKKIKLDCNSATTRILTFAYDPLIKGFDVALDACELLNKDGIRFELWASAQEKTYQYIEKRYGVEKPEWLVLLEPTDDISSLYNSVDIMISPSRSEGFSFCLAEAIYSGLPVVYSDIMGTRWADEMEMAFKFKCEDYVDLAKQIEKCNNADKSTTAQNHNRQIVERKYLLNVWKKRIRSFLQKIS